MYKGKLTHLEIRIFYTHEFFLGPKPHFREGRHENKEKRLCYFGILPIQIQLFEIENPQNPKSTPPTTN
jgi:hypothetical protein